VSTLLHHLPHSSPAPQPFFFAHTSTLFLLGRYRRFDSGSFSAQHYDSLLPPAVERKRDGFASAHTSINLVDDHVAAAVERLKSTSVIAANLDARGKGKTMCDVTVTPPPTPRASGSQALA
jgi:hypothetical protein